MSARATADRARPVPVNSFAAHTPDTEHNGVMDSAFHPTQVSARWLCALRASVRPCERACVRACVWPRELLRAFRPVSCADLCAWRALSECVHVCVCVREACVHVRV